MPHRFLSGGLGVASSASVVEVTDDHGEAARHDVVVAAGLTVESCIDPGDRNIVGDHRVVALHRQFAARVWDADACAPIVLAGPALAAVRSRLKERLRDAA